MKKMSDTVVRDDLSKRDTKSQDLRAEKEATVLRVWESGLRLRKGTHRYPGVSKSLACCGNRGSNLSVMCLERGGYTVQFKVGLMNF